MLALVVLSHGQDRHACSVLLPDVNRGPESFLVLLL